MPLCLALCSGDTYAQDLLYRNGHAGFQAGLTLALGSHVQRAGVNLNFFYVYKQFQANTEARAYFNFKNLGPKRSHPEMVISQGLLFGYGPPQDYFNPFLNSVSNQTGYSNSIAYSYNAWFNKIKTTQQTGIIAAQFDMISVVMENDIFARQLLDRFRTGAFLIQYQYRNLYQAGINCTLWTGRMRKTVRDTCFPAVGYMDTTNAVYPNLSHGLLSAQFRYHAGYSQVLQANLGVDADQVRNVMQNRFIHDVCWLPKKWFKRYNCHIPMIDDKGQQYLYKPGQKVRPAKLYWNVFSNPNVFY